MQNQLFLVVVMLVLDVALVICVVISISIVVHWSAPGAVSACCTSK